MKKLNKKTIRLLFIISIGINVLFLGNVMKKILLKHSQNKFKQSQELKQPDSVTYFIGRNEVFDKLPNDSDEVIMIGTSLTNNFEWHEIFRSVNIKNRGINADITKGILQRLDEVIESKPKKIFIEIGINDIRKNYSMDSIFNNYVKIIVTIKLKSPKTKIYIQSLLPSNKSLNNKIIDFNKQLKDYCVKNNIVFIDLYSRFVSGQILNPIYDCGDNLHLSGSGYMEWCRLIKDYINE
ncbi:MAG: sialate O-acetylesterase [Bacteroidales bacterium]|nr:sialate O-acetylesterase [Bacteroidales bacterium]